MDHGIAVTVRPIDGMRPAQLVMQCDDGRRPIDLTAGRAITITPDTTSKFCTGWYDISTHKGHHCSDAATVDSKHEQCYPCRQRTDFNPAFYNSTEISDKQAAYNDTPHSVYIAYFGQGLAKAGISADSRGLRRLREQGALMYAIIGSHPTALVAHYYEDKLISAGLRNSISKRQKSNVLSSVIDQQHEAQALRAILKHHDCAEAVIVDQVDDFFYGAYPDQPITPIINQPLIQQ